MNGGLQRVGEAVAEHPRELLVVLQQLLHLLDFLVNHIGTEQPILLGWTARHIGRTLLANALDVLFSILCLSHCTQAYHCQTANNG